MSLLRTVERASSCRNKTTTTTKTYQVASQSLFAFFCPALYEKKSVAEATARGHEKRRRGEPARALPSASHIDNCFITALVQAGSCHNHQKRQARSQQRFFSSNASITRPRPPRQQTSHEAPHTTSNTQQQHRRIHTKSTRPARDSTNTSANGISRGDLHSLVDIYGARDNDGNVSPWETKPLNEHVDIGPESLESPFRADYFTDNQYMVYSEPWSEVSQLLTNITMLLEHPDAAHEDLYALYQQLPGNRVTHIPPDTLFRLIAHLSRVPASRFRSEYADNFLSLLYDLREAGVPPSLSMWTTAIRFLGLSKGPRQAVRLWREMEQHHALRANNYTFSVLFDSAVRAGHLALAELLEREARDRHVPLDRIAYMSRIVYSGILGDGSGVRTAYARLVEAGEIVDTAVLTNVISALIDADELPAAEETFERMKKLHREKQGATQAPHTWTQRRELRKILTEAAHRYRDRPEDRQVFQDAAPLNPDWRTYRAFIRHHALETSEWSRIEALLDEMKREGIAMKKEIYHVLFQGFARHGGIQIAAWNRRNLEHIWREFEEACIKDPAENRLTPGLALTVVKAFCFCADRGRAKGVWEDILERWGGEMRAVERRVEMLLRMKRGGR